MIQLPFTIAEGPNVTDGTHWNLNQAVRIDKGLRGFLRGHNTVKNPGGGFGAGWFTIGMRRILGADPLETQIYKHLLQIGPGNQPIRKAARCAESSRSNAQTSF